MVNVSAALPTIGMVTSGRRPCDLRAKRPEAWEAEEMRSIRELQDRGNPNPGDHG